MAKRKPAKSPATKSTGSLIPATNATPLRFEGVSNADTEGQQGEGPGGGATRPVSSDKHTDAQSNSQSNSVTDAESVIPSTEEDTKDANAAQINRTDGVTDSGNVTLTPNADAPPLVVPPAHARPDESRSQAWERIRKEGRAAGLGKLEAYERATVEVDRLFPLGSTPVVELASIDPAPAEGEGLPGLSIIPVDWPDLPANAALPAEVSWVQSNRLRVRVGDRVELGRALSPAPSHATLAWLETSILYGSKWADIVARAASAQVDEASHARRERAALEVVGELLGSMAEATT